MAVKYWLLESWACRISLLPIFGEYNRGRDPFVAFFIGEASSSQNPLRCLDSFIGVKRVLPYNTVLSVLRVMGNLD